MAFACKLGSLSVMNYGLSCRGTKCTLHWKMPLLFSAVSRCTVLRCRRAWRQAAAHAAQARGTAQSRAAKGVPTGSRCVAPPARYLTQLFRCAAAADTGILQGYHQLPDCRCRIAGVEGLGDIGRLIEGLPEEFLQLLRISAVIRPTAHMNGATNEDRLRINATHAYKAKHLISGHLLAAHASEHSPLFRLSQKMLDMSSFANAEGMQCAQLVESRSLIPCAVPLLFSHCMFLS